MGDYSEFTDEELFQKIRKSDLSAFKVIYYKYYDKLCRFVWIRMSNSELAEDIAQDILAKMWANRGKIKIKKSLRAYLYRMANNSVIDHSRKLGRERQYQSETAAIMDESAIPGEDVRLEVNMAINNLPEKYRITFILSRIEGLKYEEIAKVCDVSTKTVEYRICEAVKLLRDSLSE